MRSNNRLQMDSINRNSLHPTQSFRDCRMVINPFGNGQQRKLMKNHNRKQRQQRNRKNLWNLFQKYRSEIKELKDFFDLKLSKLKVLEEKINDFIIDEELNVDGHKEFEEEEQTKSIYQNRFDELKTNNYSLYPNNNHLMFEPIIDIHIKGEDNENNNGELEDILISGGSNDAHHKPDESCSKIIEESLLISSPPSLSPFNRNVSISRKGVHNIHSKNEFMQMVEQYKQERSLIKEKVSSNVYMLRRSNDNSIVGYQCSIDDCAYMHFLRAQVNRHYKNFHSKTCSHCNQRFKRPYELSLHLKELNASVNNSMIHNGQLRDEIIETTLQ